MNRVFNRIQLLPIIACSAILLLAFPAPAASNVVFDWGVDDWPVDSSPAPAGLTSVKSIAAGGLHCVALKADATVVAWSSDSGSPTNVPLSVTNISIITAGPLRDLAVTTNGTVLEWDSTGLLPVPDEATNVVAVSTGISQDLALRSDGTVIAWGDDLSGETDVPPDLTNAIAINAGALYSLAVKSDHTVVMWGAGPYSRFPTVPDDWTNIVALASGEYHTLGLRSDGTVTGFGDDSYGQLDVPEGLSNVTAIASSWFTCYALKADGTLVAWGYDPYIPPGLTNVSAISAGGDSVEVVINADPYITHPLTNITVSSGSSATLATSAIGTLPLFYQWQQNGTNITGATDSTYTTTQPGQYTCIASNSNSIATSSTGIVSCFDVTVQTGTPSLKLQGPIGTSYSILTSTNLTGPWSPLTNFNLPSSPYIWTDPSFSTQSATYFEAVPNP